ncbi:hypothetical protein BLA6993_05032 [Burkholderia lata]|nr:hypothetical protein BLA6993_05032 [Burkholderia lata]
MVGGADGEGRARLTGEAAGLVDLANGRQRIGRGARRPASAWRRIVGRPVAGSHRQSGKKNQGEVVGRLGPEGGGHWPRRTGACSRSPFQEEA